MCGVIKPSTSPVSSRVMISEANTENSKAQDPNAEDNIEDPPISLNPRNQDWVGHVVTMPESMPVAVSPAPLGEQEATTRKTHEQTYESGRSSPLLQDLSVSPLTASSFHVMEREYDRDTWRMYKLIETARTERQVLSSSLGKLEESTFLPHQARNQQSRSVLPDSWMMQIEDDSSYGHFVTEDEGLNFKTVQSRREEEEEDAQSSEEDEDYSDEIFVLEMD